MAKSFFRRSLFASIGRRGLRRGLNVHRVLGSALLLPGLRFKGRSGTLCRRTAAPLLLQPGNPAHSHVKHPFQLRQLDSLETCSRQASKLVSEHAPLSRCLLFYLVTFALQSTNSTIALCDTCPARSKSDTVQRSTSCGQSGATGTLRTTDAAPHRCPSHRIGAPPQPVQIELIISVSHCRRTASGSTACPSRTIHGILRSPHCGLVQDCLTESVLAVPQTDTIFYATALICTEKWCCACRELIKRPVPAKRRRKT